MKRQIILSIVFFSLSADVFASLGSVYLLRNKEKSILIFSDSYIPENNTRIENSYDDIFCDVMWEKYRPVDRKNRVITLLGICNRLCCCQKKSEKRETPYYCRRDYSFVEQLGHVVDDGFCCSIKANDYLAIDYKRKLRTDDMSDVVNAVFKNKEEFEAHDPDSHIIINRDDDQPLNFYARNIENYFDIDQRFFARQINLFRREIKRVEKGKLLSDTNTTIGKLDDSLKFIYSAFSGKLPLSDMKNFTLWFEQIVYSLPPAMEIGNTLKYSQAYNKVILTCRAIHTVTITKILNELGYETVCKIGENDELWDIFGFMSSIRNPYSGSKNIGKFLNTQDVLDKIRKRSKKCIQPDLFRAVLLNFIDSCNYCGKTCKGLRCSRCKLPIYCNRECQKKDWEKHKIFCKIKS